MFEIFYFCIMLIQYFWLYIWYSAIPVLDKSIYKYNLNGVNHTANIYNNRPNNTPPNKRILLIISGSYVTTFDVYIKKLIIDLQNNYADIIKTYEIIVFEKLDKSSIIIYEDVAQYLHTLHKTAEFDDLTIMGFSSGGVVASHIMNLLADIKCEKKIITYDTPWQVRDNVISFQTNWIYRIDLLFFKIVHNIYSNHYNYADITQILNLYNNGLWNCNGAYQLIDIIQKVHQFTDEEMYAVTGFNFNQTSNTKVINIFCKYDPFVNRDTHIKYVNRNLDKINFKLTNHNKDSIGHCSDMSLDTRYLDEVVNALIS
uniref:DUF676 domain-containing protein n=1 Tax=viral metagenome TaxID=1070528 RepID=A0A6C0HXX6_9ZZZZ